MTATSSLTLAPATRLAHRPSSPHALHQIPKNGPRLSEGLPAKSESLQRVQKLAGRKLSFYQVDLLDADGIADVFTDNAIDAVIHFAALKAPGETV